MITAARVTIPAGAGTAITHFQPISAGKTTLSVNVPAGFSAPAEATSVVAMVIVPGLVVTDGLMVGKDLQTAGSILLGEPAPEGGLEVTLATSSPALLVSRGIQEPGVQSLKIKIPAGGVSAQYYLQALDDKGTVTYSASAEGYRSREGTVVLTPSGVLLGVHGPPDEAELFRKESAEAAHGFAIPLAKKHVPITIYPVQLHPEHLRAADITVQALRPGVKIKVDLKSSDPAVGTISSPVFLGDKTEPIAEFTALSVGRTTISLETPDGFTKAANATTFTAMVTE
jgi:hypothetical protein